MPFDPKRFDRGSSARSKPQHMKFRPSPFEPRLIHPETSPTDELGELELPDDLAALAEQLEEDAVHLAACFRQPAANTSDLSAGPAPRASISGKRRFSMAFVATGAIALALSLLLLANYAPEEDRAVRAQPRQSHPAVASGATQDAASPVKTRAGNEPIPADSPRVLNSIDASGSLVLLGGASAPEREGLLDLFDQSASTDASISF